MTDKDKKPKSKKQLKTELAIDEILKDSEFSSRESAESRLYEKRRLGISSEETELDLGKRLQDRRESLKLTQGELAELTKSADPQDIGISRAVISMYEVGKNRPSPRELRILCEVLKISPNLLIYGEEDPFDEQMEAHRWGASPSDAEFQSLLLYTFSELHKHHKLAILQLINGLLLGWGKGTVESHQAEANKHLIKTSKQLEELMKKRGDIN
jgi:transcriptional regulator with XRE-family HTH domain